MSILDIFKGADINEGVKEFRADKNAVLLDVRSKEEYAAGHFQRWDLKMPEVSAALTAIPGRQKGKTDDGT